MVNVSSNFNRNYEKKRKLIRDKKRARIRRKKRRLGLDEKQETPMTKKEIKEEKKKNNLLKAMKMTPEELHKLVNYRKDRIRKNRRDKRKKRYIQEGKKDMEIDQE
jgi:hypothetical protein